MAKQPKTKAQADKEFLDTYGYKREDETKAQAFSRIASRRMGQALDEIEKLESLSDKNNYEFTDDQVTKMLQALQEGCQAVADRFAGKVKGKTAFSV